MIKLLRNALAIVRHGWERVHLIDKCLLVMMALLLMQSGHALLIGEPVWEGTAQIDVVFRTSAAAIFGYFISANFRASARRKNSVAVSAEQRNDETPTSHSGVLGQIGFGTSATNTSLGRADTTEEPPRPPHATPCQTQILVVAGIGIVSLLILLTTRDITASQPSATAGISQLRDFVSGSVGFLVGTPTGNER